MLIFYLLLSFSDERLSFLPEGCCVGEDLIVSFHRLSFSPDGTAEASLFLYRATIEILYLLALL
jgi:hypothetical protein